MIMALLDRFPGNSGFTALPPGPLPDDADKRLNWLRQNLPEYAELGAVIDIVAGPGASAQAVMTGTETETFDMTDAEDLVLILDDYVGRNDHPGRYPVTTGAETPATAVPAADSAVGVSIAGVAAADAVIGTQTTAEGIRAALESAIQGLAPALPSRNRQSYLGASVAYEAPSQATTLKTALASGVEIFDLIVDSGTGFKQGDEIVLKDLAASEPDLVRTILHIERAETQARLRIERFTPAGPYAAGSAVQTTDDKYVVTGGKKGGDQDIVFSVSAGGTDVSALLKLKAADGAVEAAGADAEGRQTFRFEAGDFGSPAAATAQEIANVLNRTMTGGEATDSAGAVRVTTDGFGSSKNVVAVDEGATVALLGLATARVDGTDVPASPGLSLDSPTISLVVEHDPAHGAVAFGDTLVPAGRWRVERTNLVSEDGTDYSATTYLVVSKPGRR
jgi:hypothetical protein